MFIRGFMASHVLLPALDFDQPDRFADKVDELLVGLEEASQPYVETEFSESATGFRTWFTSEIGDAHLVVAVDYVARVRYFEVHATDAEHAEVLRAMVAARFDLVDHDACVS